jgi:hypothetical protein
MDADQFAHMIRHAAAQGGDITPFRYGHVASYDPTQHRVQCIVPSMTDQDGTPLLSPWMPLGTPFSGNGFGVQVILQGGASATNPTAGEQVLISVFDRQRGVSAVPCMFYHGTAKPPATNLPTVKEGYTGAADPVLPGDVIISAPPATTGGANSFIRIRQSGAIQIWSAGLVTADIIGGLTATLNTGDLNVTLKKGNAAVNVTGTVTLMATGVVTILGSAVKIGAAATAAFLALCTTAFQAVFNTHTHPNGGVPAPQAGANTVTTVLTAE